MCFLVGHSSILHFENQHYKGMALTNFYSVEKRLSDACCRLYAFVNGFVSEFQRLTKLRLDFNICYI